MRYDETIYFQTRTPGSYDVNTGNYSSVQIIEEAVPADVQNTELQLMQIVFGGIKKGSLTVQLQNRYEKPFDRIRYKDKTYTVSMDTELKCKQVLVLEEVL